MDDTQAAVSHPNMSSSLEGIFVTKSLIGDNKSKCFYIEQAWRDIFQGTKNWRLWTSMANAELRRRYRRTLLGPFWTTLSLAVYIGSMGIVFSYLWKIDLKNFLPYFSSGFICWVLCSTIITESCSVFVTADSLIKQIPLPYSTFAWLVVCRNLLILAHHAIFYLLIIMIMKVPINLNVIFFVPGIFLVSITGFWMSLMMGLICTRYRDLLQIVNTFLQIVMFVTPIFWAPTQMGGLRSTLFVNCNPVYHYINVIRAPLLGNAPTFINWVVVLSITLILAVIAFWFFAKHQRKLVFWI